MSDLVDAVEGVESTVDNVIQAINRVERAVENKWSTAQWVGVILVFIVLSDWLGAIWHAKWRYALTYGVSPDKVSIQIKPHDCAFLAAPLGGKYCHYERVVSTLRWATSTAGNPIASYDEGKTWSVFTPDAGAKIPHYPTVENVSVWWDKKDD